MNSQNLIDPEVRELLESLTAHARNQRRQAALTEQVDRLAAAEKAPVRKRSLWPWWAAAAAVAGFAALLFIPRNTPSVPVSAEMPKIARVESVSPPVEEVPMAVTKTPVEAVPGPVQRPVRKSSHVPTHKSSETTKPAAPAPVEERHPDLAMTHVTDMFGNPVDLGYYEEVLKIELI